MAYLELYKKYKPEKWSDIIGQDRIVNNLRNAVLTNSIPTIYGFFGVKGTGKSSTANVLAKAINCTNLQPNGDPCCECENCVAIENESMLDVHFIPAANDANIEQIRDIVEKARLRPSVGKKQVWVLDEVHSLSKKAFEALLVPLDSQKMGETSVFIMCSTEPSKINQPLLSRTVSFNFTPVSNDTLGEYVRTVADKENIEITDSEISNLILRGAGGSVRSALSNLEQYKIDPNGFVGASSKPIDQLILFALAKRNPTEALAKVAEGINMGYSSEKLIEMLFADFRDLILLSDKNVDKNLVSLQLSKHGEFIKRFYGIKGMLKISNILGKTISDTAYGTADARAYLDVAILEILTLLTKLDNMRQAKQH